MKTETNRNRETQKYRDRGRMDTEMDTDTERKTQRQKRTEIDTETEIKRYRKVKIREGSRTWGGSRKSLACPLSPPPLQTFHFRKRIGPTLHHPRRPSYLTRCHGKC